MRHFFHYKILVYLLGLVLFSACGIIDHTPASVSYLSDPMAVHFNGSGADRLQLQGISGAVVIHVVAMQGKSPFLLAFITSQKVDEILSGAGPYDEYRGYEITPLSPVTLQIQGDAPWSITISPANPKYFPVIKIPGQYKGDGNAVFFLDGEYGVATFQLDSTKQFTAWAYGPGGVNQQLSITPSGDYKGKSVLPIGAGWVIVSAKGSWSVDIQAPCCKAPPGFKPTYNP